MGSTRDTLKRRVRKTVKWAGLVVSMLLVVVWIGSCWWEMSWRRPGKCVVLAGAGCIGYIGVPAERVWRPLDGFSVRFQRRPMVWELTLDLLYGSGYLDIPFWFPAFLSLLPTGAAWRADHKYLRRARVGRCPACGYDRAGLAAVSVCPECGAAANESSPAPRAP